MATIGISTRLALCVALAALGCSPPQQAEQPTTEAAAEATAEPAAPAAATPRPLIEGLSELHFPISTQSPLAAKYFDQGIRLTYAFNHAEAIRAFEEAAKADPSCAMCYWGVALALGPNINAPMDAAAVGPALAALEKAAERVTGASEREQAYVLALSTRYSAAPDADRAALDRVYAEAMRDVAKRFPDDLDAQTLLAEALMDQTPWDYWTKDGAAKQNTAEIVALLEHVLAVDPDHPGANHFYIHAVEASKEPGKALASAKKLETLANSAGHLVHMSAHTYMRVGRYGDASRANERGALADEEYMAWCRSGGFYPSVYYPHNLHFLWASQAMEGKSAGSIASARKLREKMAPETLAVLPPGEELVPVVYYALLRFGKYDELLAEPAPAPELRYTTAIWRYARGAAFAATGKLAEARAERAEVAKAASDPALAALLFPAASAAKLVELAGHVLDAEIAAAEGKSAEALTALASAQAIEYSLNYTEPPPWYFPVRQMKGAQLLASGDAAGAEAAFREDLLEYPENGWSLYGLAESLKAQGKLDTEERQRFQTAWAAADVKLERPRF